MGVVQRLGHGPAGDRAVMDVEARAQMAVVPECRAPPLVGDGLGVAQRDAVEGVGGGAGDRARLECAVVPSLDQERS